MAMSAGISPSPVGDVATRERVELILSQLDQLPTLPAVAARLLAVASSRESSASDVAKVIEFDAPVTAAILRMVRRADLGVLDDSMTVARAVSLLGFTCVRNVALSIHLFELFGQPDEDAQTASRRRELWKHNLAVACAADLLSQRGGNIGLGADAFVCGLLHDIGKIAMDARLPKSYARVLDRVERERACILDIERDVFGLAHTVAGKRIAIRWELPHAIVECIWLHHQAPEDLPSAVKHPRMVQLIHLANNLVRRQRIGYIDYDPIGDIEALAASMGIDEAQVAGVAHDLPERMEPFLELIGMDDCSSRTLYTESLTKANRELNRVNAQLEESNRRLEQRSALFDALRHFTERLSDRDHIGDVCAAAAKSVRMLARTDSACAFVGETSSRCLHAAVVDLSDRAPSASVIELDDAQNSDMLNAVAGLATQHGLAPAPGGCDVIWQRCVGSPPPGALWMLPFVHNEAIVGAVLFVAQDETIQWLRSVAECNALSHAIALAVRTAKARLEAEQMSEELLGLNRRLRAAQHELVRSRTISMVKEMAAGAAHELNNPLAVISGRAQMELAKSGDEQVTRAMEIIVEQAENASRIVTELMRFARPEPPVPALQRLDAVLESLCQHWRACSSVGEDQISLSMADANLTVYADPTQLRAILDALVANAIEACERETLRLQINSRSSATDETVRIVIEDNGVGMTRDVLEHAIDPFYSNRPAGRGRGLGLSQAHRLADINGGRLWLESIPNVSTTVTVEMPARKPCE